LDNGEVKVKLPNNLEDADRKEGAMNFTGSPATIL
jgi:hypothetical protein